MCRRVVYVERVCVCVGVRCISVANALFHVMRALDIILSL